MPDAVHIVCQADPITIQFILQPTYILFVALLRK